MVQMSFFFVKSGRVNSAADFRNFIVVSGIQPVNQLKRLSN